jgi:hypothetical protein
MTETAPSSAAQPFPPKLSPAGRERFGELLAKQLWLLAGGLAAMVVAPSILGTATPPRVALIVSATVAAISVIGAVVIHFQSVERLGEAAPTEGQADE